MALKVPANSITAQDGTAPASRIMRPIGPSSQVNAAGMAAIRNRPNVFPGCVADGGSHDAIPDQAVATVHSAEGTTGDVRIVDIASGAVTAVIPVDPITHRIYALADETLHMLSR
ncbi:hypothetical protein [Nocardia sp. NPDC046763]|uniref:hypothetical protein n=1 Tax=Nocardia sp. NPDC046763 TaxID=3155256 RepID=UPI003401B70F